MAEEENEDVVEQPKDKTKSLVMMMIILAVLMMVLTPVITIMVFRALAPPQIAKLPSESDSEAIKPFILEGILVNTADPGSTRFVACDVAFKINNKDMSPYFLSASEEDQSAFGDEIKAEVSLLIGDRTVEQLKSREDKESLSNQIKQKVVDIFQANLRGKKKEEATKWNIRKVYFPKFTIQ